jgi:glutathione S-transferase
MATKENPIVFYDIAMRPPVEETCCSPNPWKARLALNFKGVPYSTTWVALPDVKKVREGLQVPACRKFADGTDFYTLPIIEDRAAGALVGDSYDIAAHLQATYPDAGAGDLFPPQAIDYTFDMPVLIPLSDHTGKPFPEYARFNSHVDAAFSAHVVLTLQEFPFDPATADESKAEFVRRAGGRRWEDFAVVGEAREGVLSSFRDMLGGLAKPFLRDPGGPFLLGATASYGDLIVGGWLRMMRAALPASEWAQVRSWHGGVFGRLHDALEVYAKVDGR